MILKPHIIKYSLFFIFVSSAFTESTDIQKKTLSAFERLPLNNFKSLPPKARSFFEENKCYIPQVRGYESLGPHNLKSGELAKKGQMDWVAYCFNDKKMAKILIYWGGHEKCPDRFNWASQTNPQTQVEYVDFDGFVDVYKRSEINKKISESALPLPKASHDALVDGIAWKASTVLYCNNGKWENLDGLGSD